MSCTCPFQSAQALRRGDPEPRRPRKAHAPPALDRRALRYLLSSRREVVERLAADSPKATGRPTANVSVLWKYYTTSVYRSGDLPAIATREALQNAVDAIRAAVRKRQLPQRDGRFEVTWDGDARSLTFADNGVGMSAEDVLERFLSLGASGKGGAADSSEAAGGFGVAKAVILGTSSTFRWEMRTRDNRVVSLGEDRDVEIFQLDPPVQGTALTLFDVSSDLAGPRWDSASGAFEPLMERLRLVLAACDLDDVTLVLNGRPVERLFNRRRGTHILTRAPWGEGTTATVKGHRRAPGDRRGGYWIRLNGLAQFRQTSRRSKLPADIVIDLSTAVRPGEGAYPLNAARDALTGEAERAFLKLCEEVERENESAGRDEEDEIIEPEAPDPADRAAAEAIAELTAEAFEDPELRAALKAAAGGLLDLASLKGRSTRTTSPQSSDAPASSGPDASRLRLVQPGEEAAGTPELIRAFLLEVDGRRQAATPEGEIFYPLLDGGVEWALRELAEGGNTSKGGVLKIRHAVHSAVGGTVMPGGGGLAGLVDMPRVIAATALLTPRSRGTKNPFGDAAGLRIAKRTYERPKARAFIRAWKRWVPHLIVWDTTLRMIAAEAAIETSFKPGWILNDDLTALAEKRRGKRAVIYLHPDRFAEVIAAHKARPVAIAGFLHGVACHELTHIDGRMGSGHDEGFVAARERLGEATAHLLPAIALLVSRLLKVGPGPTEAERAVTRLTREVARLKARAARDKGAARDLKRAEGALATCRASLAEAAQISANARADCTRSCQCEGVNATVEDPPAPLGPDPEHISPWRDPNEAAPGADHRPYASHSDGAIRKTIADGIVSGDALMLYEGISRWMVYHPPPGLSAAEIEGFFRRRGRAALGAVAQALGVPTPW